MQCCTFWLSTSFLSYPRLCPRMSTPHVEIKSKWNFVCILPKATKSIPLVKFCVINVQSSYNMSAFCKWQHWLSVLQTKIIIYITKKNLLFSVLQKKNQLFIVYYKKNNNYNFLNSSINQPGPNPCSLIVHPDPTRVAGWVRVGSGLGPIAGL